MKIDAEHSLFFLKTEKYIRPLEEEENKENKE